jgi:hypothetical protein
VEKRRRKRESEHKLRDKWFVNYIPNKNKHLFCLRKQIKIPLLALLLLLLIGRRLIVPDYLCAREIESGEKGAARFWLGWCVARFPASFFSCRLQISSTIPSCDNNRKKVHLSSGGISQENTFSVRHLKPNGDKDNRIFCSKKGQKTD